MSLKATAAGFLLIAVGILVGVVLGVGVMSWVASRQHGGQPPALKDVAAPAASLGDPLASHYAEGVDEAWASQQEAHLVSAFAAVSPRAWIDPTEVDCRFDSCLVRLRFTDRAAAENGIVAALGVKGLVRCSREVSMRSATAHQGYVEVPMLFVCKRDKDK